MAAGRRRRARRHGGLRRRKRRLARQISTVFVLRARRQRLCSSTATTRPGSAARGCGCPPVGASTRRAARGRRPPRDPGGDGLPLRGAALARHGARRPRRRWPGRVSSRILDDSTTAPSRYAVSRARTCGSYRGRPPRATGCRVSCSTCGTGPLRRAPRPRPLRRPWRRRRRLL